MGIVVERCIIGDGKPEESLCGCLSGLKGTGNDGSWELDLDKGWGGGGRDTFSYMGAGWRVGVDAGACGGELDCGCVDLGMGGGTDGW